MLRAKEDLLAAQTAHNRLLDEVKADLERQLQLARSEHEAERLMLTRKLEATADQLRGD